jgi:hypothetical protein
VDTWLTWDYQPTDGRLNHLYQRAKDGQWNAATDVDWTLPVPFGARLPDDSYFAVASFQASPLARWGRPFWDTFRWELQAWMVSQFLHGEQGALVVASRLVQVVPDLDSKFYAASQVVDEARHVEAFSKYLNEKIPEPYDISASLRELLTDILADNRWDVTALGMQIMVEALAMAAFRLAGNTFHDELIQSITRLVARDEARHVSFGVMSLENLYPNLTGAERADREDLVLEAACLMRKRFLLEDIWDRLEVDRADGVAYASTDPLMIGYRQAIFAKVVTALGRIGLLTPRVRDALDGLGLLNYASARVVRQHTAA